MARADAPAHVEQARRLGADVSPDPRSQTRTEVRSPTRTATEVRSPTSTSTEAYTQGNFTATVTGGAGAGETIVHIHAPPLNRVNTASSKGPRKNAQENENINAPRAGASETGVSMTPMTPAQVYGHPDFVTDVPVQGPTDPGQRAAACRWAATLPTSPACVDCGGPLPPWLRRATLAGVGERIFLGGVEVRGFN